MHGQEPGFSRDRSHGYFDRELALSDLQPVREEDGYQYFHLKRPFVFRDAADRKFVAVPGVDINGASIPEVFRSYIGEPWDWDKRYVPAAVVHDVYCTEPHRSEYSCWRVHRMFYDAARANGTDKWLARQMYAAILVGGPKWFNVFETRTAETILVGPDGSQESGAEETVISRAVPAEPPGETMTDEERQQEIARLVELMAEKEDEQNQDSYLIELPLDNPE